MAKGSLKTVLASSKETPCFRRFTFDFSSSHSKVSAISSPHEWKILYPDYFFKARAIGVVAINKLKGREKEKGRKTKMRVKLAAKLLVIAWTLMKKREVFNPELLKTK
jgi:hypothetical protein